jgi:chromatin structure-remodeling complex protein RSC7
MLADAVALKATLTSFYQVGGPTTHFGSTGHDPWSDLGHGKRGRLRALGVTEEDWILRTAEDARRVDEVLRGYREERIGVLEGPDTHCWVYNAERRATGELPDEQAPQVSTGPPKTEPEGDVTPAIKPHPLASELTFDASSEPLSPLPPDPPTATATALAEVNETAEFEKTDGGKIVVESERETGAPAPIGGWIPGVIQAAYEVSYQNALQA